MVCFLPGSSLVYYPGWGIGTFSLHKWQFKSGGLPEQMERTHLALIFHELSAPIFKASELKM